MVRVQHGLDYLWIALVLYYRIWTEFFNLLSVKVKRIKQLLKALGLSKSVLH